MPHFIVDCSQNISRLTNPARLVSAVHDAADASGLFDAGDTKVRCNFYDAYTVGGTSDDFVHVIGYLLSGRSDEQKRQLAARVVNRLMALLPTVETLSIDLRDIERTGYANRRSCLAAAQAIETGL